MDDLCSCNARDYLTLKNCIPWGDLIYSCITVWLSKNNRQKSSHCFPSVNSSEFFCYFLQLYELISADTNNLWTKQGKVCKGGLFSGGGGEGTKNQINPAFW